jgi:membrane associated rhomboid family serine protease
MGALLILEYLSTGSFAGQAMGLIVLNLAITFAIPNISIGGHLGGLAGGIAATYALAHFRYNRKRWIGPLISGLIGVAAIVVAVLRVRGYGIY